MDLTQYKLKTYKQDYVIYGPTKTTDKYGAEQSSYTVPRSTIKVMWSPVSDAASYQLYGQDISKMMQAVVYGDEDIENLDQVEISGKRYEIVSILPYNTFRLIKAKKVQK